MYYKLKCLGNTQSYYFFYTTGNFLTNDCICQGDTLTFNCVFMGTPGGSTVWTGTAFQCPDTQDAITLLHSRFMSPEFTSKVYMCNNGAIVARILGVEGSYYSSQLNITVTSYMAGKTVMCLQIDLMHRMQLFSFLKKLT